MNTVHSVLVVEDDTSSRFFLREALRSMQLSVTDVSLGADALKKLNEQSFDAWLIDANLPDIDAEQLLPLMLASGSAKHVIAMTAALEGERKQSLLRAGFHNVGQKPLLLRELATLLHLHTSHESIDSSQALPVWNKQQAMAALANNEQAWQSLKGLFFSDLAAQKQQINAAIIDADYVRADNVLHQLQSSCKLLGAERLLHIVNQLKQQPQSKSLLLAFLIESNEMLNRPSNLE